MKRQSGYRGLAAILGTVLLTAAVSGHGQNQAEEEPGGAAEGIKVHGHWVIEVRDPDGTLVNKSEFKNSLQTGGVTVLLRLLSRQRSAGLWIVRLDSPGSPPCGEVLPQRCALGEQAGLEGNLVMRTTSSTLLLSGNVTAQRDGEVSTVDTILAACSESTAPIDCTSGNYETLTAPFSLANIPAVSVQTGQQIQVTVTFSFS